jgi:tryptophan synthase alpha chain
MNRIKKLFQDKKKDILSVFITAGYPQIDSLLPILEELQANGVDMVEIGMPFSDPIADGPTIQMSNTVALDNGMNMHLLFEQLQNLREKIHIPIILMGYVNPAMQYGFNEFLKSSKEVGVDGLIIPDLPLREYKELYINEFKANDLQNVFLVTPQTSDEKIQLIDSLSDSFIYVVSTYSITGSKNEFNQDQLDYFKRVSDMNLKNPCVVGFGIHNKTTYAQACQHLNGAIIGSAFIVALKDSKDVRATTKAFVQSIKG